ncbi:hypothetical protein TNCV_407591 [Trichonephila clavipes]|nr:hypothetical protein TNCV_407591 [Trichonephila clavipes]
MEYALPLLEWLLNIVFPYSAPDSSTVLQIRVPIPQSASVSVVGCFSEDRSPVTEPVGNVELSPPIQHNASPDDKSRATVTVSFHNVTKTKQCPDLFPNQLALRITCGSDTTPPIRKEDTTPLMRCPVFVLLIPLYMVSPMANFQRNAAFKTVCE